MNWKINRKVLVRVGLLLMVALQIIVLITISNYPAGGIAQLSMTAYADDDEYEEDDDEDESPYEEVFKWVGKLAVISGALSLSWYLMKRKRVSKIPPVRKTANLFYRLHTYTGWVALALVIAHGAYFLVVEKFEDDTISGLLAFGLLLTLAIYGILLNRHRLPRYRRVHFILALVWVVATVIHAGDAIPLLVVVVGLSYGYLWWLERKALKSPSSS